MSYSFTLTNLPSELTAKIAAYALTPSPTAQCFLREATDPRTIEINEAFKRGHIFQANPIRVAIINELLAFRWAFRYRNSKSAGQIGDRPPSGYIYQGGYDDPDEW